MEEKRRKTAYFLPALSAFFAARWAFFSALACSSRARWAADLPVWRINSFLHLGQIIRTLPLFFGTRTIWWQLGQRKYLWVFRSRKRFPWVLNHPRSPTVWSITHLHPRRKVSFSFCRAAMLRESIRKITQNQRA